MIIIHKIKSKILKKKNNIFFKYKKICNRFLYYINLAMFNLLKKLINLELYSFRVNSPITDEIIKS